MWGDDFIFAEVVLKLLINSYWCCPGKASEPGVAWRYIEGLSSRHDITIVTGTRYRKEILEAELNNVKFYFIENDFHEKISLLGAKIGMGAAFGGVYHYYWQIKAFLTIFAKGKEFRNAYDVFHHLNSFSWRWPPLLVFLFNKSIWGPIGGGQSIPPSMTKGRGLFLRYLRPVLQSLSKLDPVLSLCMLKTGKIVCANSDTFDLLPRWVRSKSEVRLETAIDSHELNYARSQGAGESIIAVGNLIAWKGFDLVVKSMKKILATHPNAKLKIVGDGVERKNLESLVKNLEIEDSVIFLGKIPYHLVKEQFRESNIFVWGSLQDTSGNVVLEALSEGLPVVGVDTGGTRDIVEDYVTGLKIFPSSEARVVDGMARAVCMLLDNPELSHWMSENCRRSARDDYSWDGLVNYINHKYDQLINEAVCD